MNKRKRNAAAAILIPMAAMGLIRIASSPQMETMRTVDMIQLLGFGACLGVAFSPLLRKPFQE